MVKTGLALILFFFGISANAQTSVSATVESRVRVIEPITITKTVDLNFGNVISAYNPGIVVLSPNGNRVAQGVQISNNFPGDVTPAEAIVKHGRNNYSITLPESVILYSQENPSQFITINEFTVSPEIGEIMDILRIGATLNLEANQAAGFYTNNSGFNITVSYN